MVDVVTPAAPAAPAPAPVSAAAPASAPIAAPAPAPAVTAPAPAGPAPTAAASAPVSPPAVESSPPPAAPAATQPVTPDAAAAAAAPKPTQEFTPSLLELGAKAPAPVEAAKPTEAAKPADAAAVAPEATPPPAEAPGEYKFAFPEGFDAKSINQERMSELTGILRDMKAPPEKAQALLDMHLKEVNQIADRHLETSWDVFNKRINEWRDEVKKDPEIGGSRLDSAMAKCASFIEQYGGSPQDIQIIWDTMKTTGAGNRLQIVKMFHRAAEALARESTPVVPTPPRQALPSREQRGLNRYSGTAQQRTA